MKQKRNKLAKLERNRFSVFCSDDKCYLCDSTYQLTWDEIYKGRNRQKSMQYGFCIRLCLNCHRRINEDYDYINHWQKKAQNYFETHYGSREDFLSEFYRNYLD